MPLNVLFVSFGMVQLPIVVTTQDCPSAEHVFLDDQTLDA